jgi:hypothetical protein
MEHMKKGETRPSNWKGSLEAKWQCHIPSSHSHFLRFPLFSWCVCPLLECRMIMNDFWHTTRLKWYWGKTTELKIYWAPDCWHQSFESQLRPRPGVAQRLLQLCLAKIRVSSKKTHTQVFLGVPWNSHTFSSSIFLCEVSNLQLPPEIQSAQVCQSQWRQTVPTWKPQEHKNKPVVRKMVLWPLRLWLVVRNLVVGQERKVERDIPLQATSILCGLVSAHPSFLQSSKGFEPTLEDLKNFE